MRAPRSRREPLLETIASLLHRLAGTGGTLGFSALGDLARLLERVCLTMLRYPQEGFSARLLELTEGADELLRIIDSDAPAEATLGSDTHLPPARTPPESSLVCVVARQQSLTRQLHVALEGLGHEVLEFSSCAELAARAAGLEIAAIVVQLEEGQARPAELAQLRATQRFPAPIVLIGEGAGFGDYLASVRTSADGYFAVPLDLPRLEARIRQLIERGRGDPLRVLVVDDDPNSSPPAARSSRAPA
jgi:CheY-like chemotaxis protein